jgi:hypothetical protein
MERNSLMDRRKEKRLYSKINKERLNRQTREWHKRNHKRSLVVTARARAKKQNIPFDLVPEDIVVPEICPVLGIPLIRQKGKRNNNTPSLDRIIPEKGYVKDNVRIISWRANRLKCDASFEELEKLYLYMKKELDIS